MLSAFLSLICLYGLTTLIGYPIHRLAIGKHQGRISMFLPSLVGVFAIGVTWLWAFGIGGGRSLANLVLAVLLLVGIYLLGCRAIRYRLAHDPSSRRGSIHLSMIVLLGVTIVSAVSWTGLTQHSYPARIGPDAVGYVVSARVLTTASSYGSYEREIELRAGKSISELLSVNEPRVYSLPSFTDQVGTEIILGALRWTTPGLIASITQFVGNDGAWSILNTWALLCLLLSVGIGLELAVRRPYPIWLLVFGTTSFLTSTTVTMAYVDGFMAQVVVLPFIMVCVLAAISLKDPAVLIGCCGFRPSVLAVVGFAGMAVFYLDALLFAGPITVLFVAVTFVRQRQILPSRDSLRRTIFSAFLAILFCAPLLPHFWRWSISRLTQTAINGYWQPTWVSPIEVLLQSPLYRSAEIFAAASKGSVTVGSFFTVLMWLGSAILVYFVLRAAIKLKLDTTLFVATSFVVFAVYLQNTVRDLNNYQFLKAMSYAQPLLWITIIKVLDSSIKATKHRLRLFRVPLLVLAVISTAIYVLDVTSRDGITVYPNSISRAANADEVRKILTTSVVLGPGNHLLMGAVAASSDVLWAHRSFQGVATDFTELSNRPLYWLAFADGDVNLACIEERLGAESTSIRGGSFGLFRIADQADKSALSLSAAQETLAHFFSSHGLGALQSGWTPTECTESQQ